MKILGGSYFLNKGYQKALLKTNKPKKIEIQLDWLREWCEYNDTNVFDIMNVKFVNDYINHFNPRHIFQIVGPHKCKNLGRFLSKAYKLGILKRGRVGISMGIGYPKWVFCYSFVNAPTGEKK